MLVLCAKLLEPYMKSFGLIKLVNSFDAQLSASVFSGKKLSCISRPHKGETVFLALRVGQFYGGSFHRYMVWSVKRFSFGCLNSL